MTDPIPATMRAAVLSAPGLDNLRVKDLPVPVPPEGWVRIRVMAFGLNRSEYHSVTGRAEGMTYPRVLGIEAAGMIDLDPAGELAPGTQAATMTTTNIVVAVPISITAKGSLYSCTAATESTIRSDPTDAGESISRLMPVCI